MRKTKRTIALILIGIMVMMLSVSSAFALSEDNGVYTKTIKGATWYFTINDYTDRQPSSKYLGVVHIYKGKKNYDRYKMCFSAHYYKTGSHQYTLKKGNVKIRFTIKSNSVVVKQLKGKIKGVRMNGNFKLHHHHYA